MLQPKDHYCTTSSITQDVLNWAPLDLFPREGMGVGVGVHFLIIYKGLCYRSGTVIGFPVAKSENSMH